MGYILLGKRGDLKKRLTKVKKQSRYNQLSKELLGILDKEV